MADQITRQEAQAKGLKRYFTGKPCSKGHTAERYTGNKTCVVCADALALTHYYKDPAKRVRQAKEWRQANRAQYNATQRKLRPKYRAVINSWTAAYRQAKIDRIPPWQSATDRLEIETIYAYCAGLREAGLDYHVDHIVPLRGENVSGLHVPWNLQVISGVENMSKGNTFNG